MEHDFTGVPGEPGVPSEVEAGIDLFDDSYAQAAAAAPPPPPPPATLAMPPEMAAQFEAMTRRNDEALAAMRQMSEMNQALAQQLQESRQQTAGMMAQVAGRLNPPQQAPAYTREQYLADLETDPFMAHQKLNQAGEQRYLNMLNQQNRALQGKIAELETKVSGGVDQRMSVVDHQIRLSNEGVMGRAATEAADYFDKRTAGLPEPLVASLREQVFGRYDAQGNPVVRPLVADFARVDYADGDERVMRRADFRTAVDYLLGNRWEDIERARSAGVGATREGQMGTLRPTAGGQWPPGGAIPARGEPTMLDIRRAARATNG